METQAHCYQFDGIEVRPASLQVRRGGLTLDLEPKAFRVLVYLIENRDRAITKEELNEQVWEGVAVTDNALTRIVAQLRKELGDDAKHPRYIQTLPTLGYRFVAGLDAPAASQPPLRSPRIARRWVWLAAAVAIVAAVGGAAWRFDWLDRDRVSSGSLQPLQLTTSPGLALGASLDPEGSSIAFSSNRSGRFELYVRPAKPTGSERQITSDGQQNIEPSWSPDGKTIAYHSAARHGIWVIPAAGDGTPHRLTPFGSRPVWSPDGSQLAFRSMEPDDLAWFDWAGTGESTIFTVGADGSNLRRVTTARNPPGQHADPNWSPDGKSLIFAALGPMGARASWNTLWTITLPGGELKQVTTENLPGQASPVISPDGRTVYFSALAPDGFGIYSASLTRNAPPVPIVQTGRDSPVALTVSRDGKRMLFTRVTNVSQIWQTGSDANPAKALYQDEVLRAKLPTYSPDGKHLAYIVQPQNATQALWIMNADGSEPTEMSADQGFANGPLWSSDSTAVIYAFFQRGIQLRKITIADRSTKILLDQKENLTRAHVFPDEQNVVYDTGRPLNVWIKPLPAGKPRQLTFDKEGAGFPVLSWDGQWIAYELYRGDSTELAVMDRNGEHQKAILSGPGNHYAYSFASDNRRLAYTACPDGVWNVYTIDRISGETKQVTHYTAFGSVVRSPAWRPGSEQMAFEYTEVKGNVYSIRF